MKNKLMLAFMAIALTMVSCSQDRIEEPSQDETANVSRPYNALNYLELVPMLEHYDKTRKPVLEKALGFEDTRMNYYSIETLENYIKYVKTLSREKGIKFTGINFVSAAYPENTDHGVPNYQNLLFMPTTEIGGKNICFDPVQSTSEKTVTVKEMLASYGYNWVYDSKEDYDNRNKTNGLVKRNSQNRSKSTDVESGAGNRGQISPPY
ncbi:hypothetical protein [Tenacibaculum sp. MAR_2009_124]|uniref:hypothetical protein n=1 Tax=Tenacibaculum sp. MAR_2009_124 TaxID=1250059 RepID=UPI000B847D9A|nr:hypothetical protein [Tenacibaculum sp. MAR_2009_124]